MKNNLFSRLRADLRIRADRPFWRGGAFGLILFALLVWAVTGYFFRTGWSPWVMAFLGLLAGGMSIAVFAVLSLLLSYHTRALPNFFFAAMGGAIGALITAHFIDFRWPDGLFYPAGFVLLWVNAGLVGSVWMIFQSRKWDGTSGEIGSKGLRRQGNRKLLWLSIFFLALTVDVAGLYWLLSEGHDPYPLPGKPASMPTTLADSGLENPGESGAYSFDYFTYGSGSDRRRPEFAGGARYATPSVDATRLLPDWKGKKKKWRERYWGFGVKNFPLNGRVWMPAGEGPFPLALIVHGNHGMEAYSDPGYAYLGELLASRGCIAVSVDENFLNGTWSGDFRGREMPARAWLLLQHLQQWRRWNQDATHPLHGRADLNRVLLVGHSRGGEAVAIAAAFNRLDYFPDDARERFDFRFGIRGLVAIAPTDKRYTRRIRLDNVSYLSLQGSYDSDEASFFGRRQYQRIQFTDTSYHFKAGLVIHRANHGQFNTTWGRFDAGGAGRWLLNVGPLIAGEEQRRIARTYIGAFVEAVVQQRREFLPLFKDAGTAADWLPAIAYVNSFQDSREHLLLSFEEDIDLTTGPDSIRLRAAGFRVWREEELRFRDRDTQGNNALVLGWNYRDSLPVDTPAVYSIMLSKPAAIRPEALLISLATGNPAELNNQDKTKEPKKSGRKTPENRPDFTLRLTDSAGYTATLPVSRMRQLVPRLQVQFLKLKSFNQQSFGAPWEAVLETFEAPLDQFDRTDAAFAPAAIRQIDLVFDRTQRGVVIVDEVGLAEGRD